jgi:hypothetical protein
MGKEKGEYQRQSTEAYLKLTEIYIIYNYIFQFI